MHTPVLLKAVLEQLDPRPGQKFIDATVDGGGHALAILERIQPGGKLLGIESDGQLLQELERKMQSEKRKVGLTLINDSYTNLKIIAEREGFVEADGILFDYGLSSWHYEQSGKGFSFQKDEVLDMRYNTQPGTWNVKHETAAEIINQYPREEIEKILREYGEESFAEAIARAIVKTRQAKPIISTFQLVAVIESAVPGWYRGGRRLHPATKTFQALRIAVNHELENVESGLRQALTVVPAGGRVAAITFHSLEDRIVKTIFKSLSVSEFNITKKPITASREEIISNPRARSAKLRVCTKLN